MKKRSVTSATWRSKADYPLGKVDFPKDLLVHVGTPSTETWLAQFGTCLIAMLQYEAPFSGASSLGIRFNNMRSSILSMQRHKLVKNAQEEGSTHILFIDSDQTFPKDTLYRLLAHRKPVVACNIATKQFPSKPTARSKGGHDLAGTPIYTTDRSPALEKCWRIGTGVMLLDIRVFDEIPQPWFDIEWVPELEQYRGEDWSLCQKLEDAGIPIWIDHKLSLEIGHVGGVEYTHDMIPVPRDVYESAKEAS